MSRVYIIGEGRMMMEFVEQQEDAVLIQTLQDARCDNVIIEHFMKLKSRGQGYFARYMKCKSLSIRWTI